MPSVEFILYVKDQQRSRDFYSEVLQMEPHLHVAGMTEFRLNNNCKLGLMPESGIARIISPPMPHPSQGSGIPRCELYLLTPNAEASIDRCLNAGAELISTVQPRNWGHKVGYCSDPDGHILAWAAE
jgi:uncharacterized glyoxalase superfamily protein PhnB